MKILIATGLYPPEIGGPATYVLMLEDELPKRGIDVVTVPFGWVRQYPKVVRHLVYAWKLWVESKHADIVYALDPISVGVPALLVSRIRRKPFLIRLGGDYAWEQGRVRFGLTETLDEYLVHPQTAPLPVRLLAFVQSFVTARATVAVAPSQYLKSVVEKWGVKEDAIKVIYSALFPLQAPGTKEEIRSQLQFTYPTIVSAGRLVPWKGFAVLIDVVAALKETYPEITLVIVGDGEEAVSLKRQVAKCGLQDQVRFTDRVSKDALGATIKGADVFVLNTAYEGLSHQLIEVMDIGTPIVTTFAGGNPELITDGVSGFLVPFNDAKKITEAVTRVLSHPETQLRITQTARGRSKDFSQSITVDKIEQLLNDIYAKSRS